MKAVRCDAGRVRVVDVDRPPGEGVRVHVRSAGICGSDLHMIDGGFPVPVTLGHEMAGVLDDGRAVAVEPLQPCGVCEPCLGGDYHLCHRGSAGVMGVAIDGGMAEEVVVPERCLIPLAPGVAPEQACLVEPLAVAEHGLRRARLSSGERVGVIGGGAIGLCAVAAAVHAGAEVGLEARHDVQRAAGERLGAGPVREGCDLVIDAAGTTSALERAAALCRPGGRLLLLATYWDGLVLPAFPVCLKEIDVVPASMYASGDGVRDVDRAAALLAARPEIAATLITHRFPLYAAVEAFEAARDRGAGAIKVVLEP